MDEAEDAIEAEAPTAGRRRPTPDDLPTVLELVERTSLRRACRHLGLHPGHTHAALKANPDLWTLYTTAIALRGEDMVEQVLGVSQKVIDKTLKPEEARVISDNLKWAKGQMDPKPIRHEHTGPNGGAIPLDVRSMSKEDLEAEIAALSARRGTHEAEADEG